MTDHHDERIDFSALDAYRDSKDLDASVSAVMARVRTRHAPARPSDPLSFLADNVRWLAAAAVIVVATSTVALRTSARETPRGMTAVANADPVATWSATGVAPTAAELVTYTQGYRP